LCDFCKNNTNSKNTKCHLCQVEETNILETEKSPNINDKDFNWEDLKLFDEPFELIDMHNNFIFETI
jgi:hypothetical protein